MVDPVYKNIANRLGLNEWNEVVWIGRYFSLDNDYGEHWFDNWDLRETLEQKALNLGLDSSELLIIDPDRFKNDKDGPCHTAQERVLFWKDVLLSLHLSLDTVFREARKLNEEKRHNDSEEFIGDLEERIANIITGGV